MIRGRDFIFTGLQSWDITIGSNAKDIALEISKHNRVLYVNSPLSKSVAPCADPSYVQRKKVVDKVLSPLRKITDNLWVLDFPFTVMPINPLPDGWLFDFVNRLNNKQMCSFIMKTMKSLEFNDYILFIDNDIYRSLYAKEYLKPALSIYYRRDNMATDFWKKHAPRIEPMIGHKSDLVLANSIQLAETMLPYNKHSYDIGQGLVLDKYFNIPADSMPADIKNLKHPIIGYVGGITSLRLDADLLYDVAARRPLYTLVMVGSEDEYFKQHALHTLPNVTFLGEKAQDEVPAYMASFDVCINPQKVNEVTIGNYPRKIDEYLALGKPVVATKTKAMELFADYVWNCSDADQYIAAIDEALSDNSPSIVDKRIAFAQTHTWENSVAKIYSHIKELESC